MDKLKDLMKNTNTYCQPLLVEGPTEPYEKGKQLESLNETIKLIENYPNPVKILCLSPATSVAYIMDSSAKNNVSRIYLENY